MMAEEMLNSRLHEGGSKGNTAWSSPFASAVEELQTLFSTQEGFHHVGLPSYPSHHQVVQIIQRARRILFPGYFVRTRIENQGLEAHLRKETQELFKHVCTQVILSFQHDCLRFDRPCSKCTEQGQAAALGFIQSLPRIGAMLYTDVRAALDGDPAAKSYDEVISCYPGLVAITAYRLAHRLYEAGVPILPRMMTEYAHSHTGIDIHPGARIGESFFIDHGTGVVVGETTEIGPRVRLYQGVTLGALSLPRDARSRFRNKKRHPTIEDDVIIYSNATILGAEAVIGARSVIGGNVWITGPVPRDSKVMLKRPELTYSVKSKAGEGPEGRGV